MRNVFAFVVTVTVIVFGSAACGIGSGQSGALPTDGGADGALSPNDASGAAAKIIAPDLGDATSIEVLARGPADSVLVLSVAGTTTKAFAIHRVTPDGSVSWSVPLALDGVARRFVAAVKDDLIAVASEGDRSIALYDASGRDKGVVDLDTPLDTMIAAPGGGIAGLLTASSTTRAEVFRWSGEGPVNSVPISPEKGRSANGFLVLDDAGTFWIAGVNAPIERIDEAASASELSVGSAQSCASARAGGGVFALVIPNLGEGVDGIAELDGAGAVVGSYATPETGNDTNSSRRILLRDPGGAMIFASVDTQKSEDGVSKSLRLRVVDVKSGKAKSFPFGYEGRLTAGVTTERDVWLGGHFAGQLRVGNDTIKSGPKEATRPLLVRFGSMKALSDTPPGSDCAAHTAACRKCVDACPQCENDTDCHAAKSNAAICACRAPEAFGPCFESYPHASRFADPLSKCYATTCAAACGVGE